MCCFCRLSLVRWRLSLGCQNEPHAQWQLLHIGLISFSSMTSSARAHCHIISVLPVLCDRPPLLCYRQAIPQIQDSRHRTCFRDKYVAHGVRHMVRNPVKVAGLVEIRYQRNTDVVLRSECCGCRAGPSVYPAGNCNGELHYFE